MLRRFQICAIALATLGLPEAADASFSFTTITTATQKIDSGLGSFTLVATGPQQFVIDTAAGTATVHSFFQGNDLAGFSYNLYNTTYDGTVTSNGVGGYHIVFKLLFELDVTSGPYAGLALDTHANAIFEADNISTIPFGAGVTFADPNRPNDGVAVYYKGTNNQFGTSSNRTVRLDRIVPEPSSVVLLAVGLGSLGSAGFARGRRARRIVG